MALNPYRPISSEVQRQPVGRWPLWYGALLGVACWVAWLAVWWWRSDLRLSTEGDVIFVWPLSGDVFYVASISPGACVLLMMLGATAASLFGAVVQRYCRLVFYQHAATSHSGFRD